MLAQGTILSGRYRVESVLGKGGMGAVYLARVPNLGNKAVAIKEMTLQMAEDDGSAVEQFRKEATFLAHLEHPNLVKVSDYFEENSCHYLVMEHIEGSTLEALLRTAGTPVPQDLALNWAEELCSVLNYLHTRKPPILFRDLKPSNVMLDKQRRIRLIDFGIARVLDPGKGTSTFLQGVGSAGYAPLEQYDGHGSTDVRSDIYSMGATLFHLLANQAPPSPIGMVSQQLSLPDLTELNPKVAPALNDLVHKMMGLRQDERPESVAYVWDRLKAIRAGESVTPPVVSPEPVPQVKTSTFPKAAVAAALVAVLGIPILGKALTKTELTHKTTSAPSPVASPEPEVAKNQPQPAEIIELDPIKVKPRSRPRVSAKAPPLPRPKRSKRKAKITKSAPKPRTAPKAPNYPTAKADYPKAKPDHPTAAKPEYPTAIPQEPVSSTTVPPVFRPGDQPAARRRRGPRFRGPKSEAELKRRLQRNRRRQ